MTGSKHYSVLLSESVDALITNPDGIYVDGTFGRGGHSSEILKRLSERGALVAFDKDPEAVAVGKAIALEDSRFHIVHGSFIQLSALSELVVSMGRTFSGVDGILLDLGVSSPQLDVADRGFSFMKDGPLDMRMNNAQGQTAADWLNTAEEDEIAFVLKEYGEEKFARRMARAVVNERTLRPLETTAQFADIVSRANPRWEKGKHPATRAFQAVRIYINSELDDLAQVLTAGVSQLNSGGRFVVISFHSLEDRMVKRFFRDQSRGRQFPAGIPVTEDMLERKLKIIGRANRAGQSELKENIRSRSAVVRIAEKL